MSGEGNSVGKRRAHGEGGLFARNRGTAKERWVGRLTLEDGTRRDVYGRTQAEAKKKLDELKAQLAAGLAPTSERLTTGQFLTDWLQNTAKTSVRPGTFRGYETIVTNYLVPQLGRIPLVKLTPQDVQRFQNELLRRPRRDSRGTVSSGTVTNARRVLGRALEQATAWRMIPRNPVRVVDGPHVTRKEIMPLDPDQARELLAAIRGDRLEALYTVALALGLRRGEALGLKWSDVDLDDGLLHVRRSLQRAHGKLELLDVKTKKSRRTVSLPLFAIRALQKHRLRQEDERQAALDRWTETGLVFTSPFGAPLDPQIATRSFTRVLKRAGLPHQRFHDLRHACASLLLAQGLDLKVIQEILGHSTITITGNLYAHVMLGLKRHASAEMDALLGDAPAARASELVALTR
jgi:integrase